ncbi:MAG TPA: indolepyruvate oxidoreductase subunit beta family protein [Burkholderiaceae bacterium]|jgi:indolepyruvate ferredoxin oxidoreductase beta subunit|nr:indolepyruvate oxidoreductase subunit beta family protein [Burkholderiaceae bacterium]
MNTTLTMPTPRGDAPLTMLLCALGGEGGGVLADWLVDTALHCGHPVQATSIPGVAQRTGATTYYVEISPRSLAELGGRRPVFGLYAVPGALDLLVGSELLELARQAVNGMVSSDRTAVIASSSRTLTTVEKMGLGDGRVPSERLVEVLRRSAQALELHDLGALAAEAGTVISAVMFGAIAGWCVAQGRLPFARQAYEDSIRRTGVGVQASLKGFGLAFDRVSASARGQAAARALLDDLLPTPQPVPSALAGRQADGPANGGLVAADLAAFPDSARQWVRLGHARVVEYQDAAYGRLYLQRLQRIAAVGGEPTAVPGGPGMPRAMDSGDALGTLVGEVARWLALWMAFDDIVRVADLKSRASRWERVQRETQVQAGEVVRLYEHFKPGVEELADLLPPRWAEALRRQEARRLAAGQAPREWSLRLPTHRLHGLLGLRLLASLKGLRRRGSRWANEQAAIERWLQAVEAGARRSLGSGFDLGLEVACCGRLIKGYGSTHRRGRQGLDRLLEALEGRLGGRPADEARVALRQLREAALADEGGMALQRGLAAQGLPQRAVAELPIRFVRRRPAAAETGD